VLISSLMISGYIIAGAQTTSTNTAQTQPVVTSTQATSTLSRMTYPIPELGNCASQGDCKAYCDVAANQQACLNFAQAHGLMRADEVSMAKKMLQLTQSGQTPGGCTSKDACESYCSVASHAAECISFAEKNGILKGKDLQDAQKVLPFIESGQTPGGCTTKTTCEAYCSDSSHATECANFAEKAGLMTPQEAAVLKATGGKGPGGCDSKESCNTFCNQKENQQACFDFAKQHNLIPADQLQNIEQGAAQLRAGLSQMPQQVLQCLTNKVGSSTISQIESGALMPSQDVGDAVNGCFEQFRPQMAAQAQQGLKNAPPQVLSCLQNALGADGFQKFQQGQVDNTESGDKIKNCFEQMRGNASGTEMNGNAQFNFNNMPPQAQDCVRQKLGVGQGASSSQNPPTQEQVQSAVEQCAQQQQPQSQEQGQRGIMPGPTASGTFQGAPNTDNNRPQNPEDGRNMMRQNPQNPLNPLNRNQPQQGPDGMPGNVQQPGPGQINGIMPQGIPHVIAPQQGAAQPVPQQAPSPESQ